ncbi:MAG: hypothetical protein H0T80_17480 [Betaproteobacteria bacterium]|nr:hypothetical protein [Betaproteobacteria bacterium]
MSTGGAKLDLQVTTLDPSGAAQPIAQRISSGALAVDGAEHTDVRSLFRSLRGYIQRRGDECAGDYAKQGAPTRNAISDH